MFDKKSDVSVLIITRRSTGDCRRQRFGLGLRHYRKEFPMRYLLALAVLGLANHAFAGNETVPGELTAPYPTITNLAVEWAIEGDDNLNATVSVKYRQVSETRELKDNQWHDAMPLIRVPAGESKTTKPIFKWTNKLSGSIFDLRPESDYEIALTLKDPDGGAAEKTIKVKTRPVPKAAADAPVRNVDPKTIHDVKPGEIAVLAAGDYGDFVAKADGEPGKPIVYRAAGKGTGAMFASVSLANRKHVIIEGLTIRSKARAAVNLLGAEDCAVKRCDIQCVYGIRASTRPGAKNCYIADNTIQGTTPWTNEAMGASGENIGDGVEITGPGNVVCHNKITGFRDCISHMEDEYTYEQYCNDFYNNDLYIGADDGIEGDFAMGNCRFLRNRLTNCFVGLSSQPGLGGPTYFIRNVMYNLTYAPFKLHRFSKGDVILHNTVVKGGDGMACFAGVEFDHAFFRNNLCIGGPAGDQKWGGYGNGTGMPINLYEIGAHCDIDYDAIGAFKMPFKGRIGKNQLFTTPEEMKKGPHEKNGIVVGMEVFKNIPFPEKPETEYQPPDLRPVPGAPVVDAAQVLANVNDKFAGKAPDIGAYESGQELPIYGPRPQATDESTQK
jgi:hypothetical protein